MAPIKTRLADAADALAGELEALSHRIHAHPELGFEEVQASGWLADFLAAQGFKVERGVAGVDTAFRATIETGTAPPSPSCARRRCPASGRVRAQRHRGGGRRSGRSPRRGADRCRPPNPVTHAGRGGRRRKVKLIEGGVFRTWTAP
jgi:hypothetical protein